MFAITIAILIVFLTLIYYYLKSAYFTLRGPIPGIPPQFLFGNLLQAGLIGRKPIALADILLKWYEKLGDVYQIWFGSMHLIVVNSLQDAQHIFSHRHIYDQGDVFTETFKLINPNAVICLKGCENNIEKEIKTIMNK